MKTDLHPPADSIFFNAKVITLDPEVADGWFVAIKNDKIIGVGNKSDLELFKGRRTKLVNCEGGTIIPGFNDAHCHLLSYAITLLQVDCSPPEVSSIAEIQKHISKAAQQTPKGKWVRAANYDEFELAEKRPPSRWELDQAAPENPVILVHRTGQHCVLNSLALQRANITRPPPDLPGGTISRDSETGEPTGLISGRNDTLVKAIPPVDKENFMRGLKQANQKYLSLGITSLQDTGWDNGPDHWQRVQALIDQGALTPRYSMLAGTGALEEFHRMGLSTGSGNDRLRLGGIKIALDETTGCLHPPQKDINHQALQAVQAGFQLAMHVSDVHMLKASLTALEFVAREVPNPNSRHRLEHCGVCPPDMLARLKSSRAIVACQPSFLYYLGQRYLDEVSPAQLKWIFPFGSYKQNGIKMAFGSDSPFVPCNPLTGIYAAVTRRVINGSTLAVNERISLLDAIKMYTWGGAYASFEEDLKGSITPAKLADLAILSDDIFQVAPEDIKDIKVKQTIIAGRTVWKND